MSASDCVFCRDGLRTPVLRETATWLTALNRNQNLLGKLIVVLRRHLEDITGLSTEEWIGLREHVDWGTERLRRAFAPDHFNYAFLQNQDRHVHLHVVPRYASARAIAGREFVDPDYPSHDAVPAPHHLLAGETIAAIEAALTEPINGRA